MEHPVSTARRRRDEVGGDFEVVDPDLLSQQASVPPWAAHGGPIAYVQTGRQALAVAAATAHEAGHRHVLVPAYLCDSMLTPFVALGFTLEGIAVDDHLHMRVDDLARSLSRTERPAVLHGSYFGQSTPPELAALLVEAARDQAFVVADETHRLFSPPEDIGTVRVASLRKLLPVPDGGYVVGARAGLVESDDDADAVRQRLAAMRLKSRYLFTEDAGSAAHHVDQYRNSESRLHEGSGVRPISGTARRLIARFRYDRAAHRRRTNADTLLECMDPRVAARVLNPPDERTTVPSHLVLRNCDARQLQSALAAERIFCPIHWPPSRLLGSPEPWPKSYLSVPVDQRYDRHDMVRVARALNRLDRPLPGGAA